VNIDAYFEVCRPLHFLNMGPYNADFVAPLLGNRRCRGNHFVPLMGFVPMILPTYELDGTTSTELLQSLCEYVT